MTTPTTRMNRLVAAWRAFLNPPEVYGAADMEWSVEDVKLYVGWVDGVTSATWTCKDLLQVDDDE